MGIGGGIFLITVGAILAYAVNIEPFWLDLDVVGWVLMLAGGTLVVLTVWFWRERRRKGLKTVVEDTRLIHSTGPVMPDAPDVEIRNPAVPPDPPNLPPPSPQPPPQNVPPPQNLPPPPSPQPPPPSPQPPPPSPQPQNVPPQNVPPQNVPPQNVPPQNVPPQNVPPRRPPPPA
jgi:hypothetical protein